MHYNLLISAHPILFFINPSIVIKYNFYKNNNLTTSSIHGISYPTLILNAVKSSGKGGLISPQLKIPIMFSLHSRVIATYRFDDFHYLTRKIAFEFALNNYRHWLSR